MGGEHPACLGTNPDLVRAGISCGPGVLGLRDAALNELRQPPPCLPMTDAERPATEILHAGGVIAFPTDTLYGIGCAFDHPRAIERVLAMRGIDRGRRPLTFLLPDLGELARYAQVTEAAHRILGHIFPGPYCVELLATRSVPDPYVVGHRRTIGVRVPDHPFCERLLWSLGVPILTATAKSRQGRVLTSAAQIG